MTQAAHAPAATKSPLDAAQKIVAELQGMTDDHQALALKFAIETLGLQMPTSHAPPIPAPGHSPQAAQHPVSSTPAQRTDIKTFTAAKAPKSDQQFAAVVAYFYQFEAPEGQKQDSIDAATMKDAARLARRKQVSDWSVTLDNARRTGYLDKAGRGKFKLNAVGENLVAITLPGNTGTGGATGAGSKRNRPNKKKSTGKKTAKTG
jgi:hypothetical protein